MSISPEAIYDDPLVNKVQEAGEKVISEYPPFEKRKNSVASISSGVLQALNLVAVAVGVTNPWLAIGLGIAIAIVETIFHAATKGPVTKSGVKAIEEKFLDIITTPDPVVVSSSPGASTYEGLTVTG
ncbi:putative holin [Corynebacterium phage P1201]|uniref:Putative holin n=1 Tax=Corynebacterium phage P1201 TaxID=384848 RepID=A7IYC4_9CAUD|nr:holin [Corynebacterium phage P1201]ABF57507.1 putative holin [Corynebacterium phage P1201]